MKLSQTKAILFCSCFIIPLLPCSVNAQKQDWVKFSASYDSSSTCITEVDLNLKEQEKRIATQPFLVKTGIRFNHPTYNGLESDEELPTIDSFVNSVKLLLDKKVSFSHAGNFTHNDVQGQYFYASDTIGLRQLFVDMYAQKYPNYNLALTLKYEPGWDSYFKFLYPSRDHLQVRKTKMRPFVSPPYIPKLSSK